MEIIRVVDDSELSIRQTLNELGIHRSNFYKWYRWYLKDGLEGLRPKNPKVRTFWNKIPHEVKDQIVYEALEKTKLSRFLDYYNNHRYHESLNSRLRLMFTLVETLKS